jgi:hypothetical protein
MGVFGGLFGGERRMSKKVQKWTQKHNLFEQKVFAAWKKFAVNEKNHREEAARINAAIHDKEEKHQHYVEEHASELHQHHDAITFTGKEKKQTDEINRRIAEKAAKKRAEEEAARAKKRKKATFSIESSSSPTSSPSKSAPIGPRERWQWAYACTREQLDALTDEEKCALPPIREPTTSVGPSLRARARRAPAH